MKKINIALVGLGQIGNYLLNELNKKKRDIEIKTGKKINIVAISAKNINKKRKFRINKKIFYKKDLFVKILPINSNISTNEVINTNYCHVSVCKSKHKNKLIILSAIDNLIKGGAGQAVQNLNHYFGYNEKKGLI